MSQVRLIAISGSTRQGSFNQRLVELAAESARKAGAEVTTLSLADYPMPLFDHHLEATAFPQAALDLKARFVAHDGFLMASPEHNGSIPAALKNAIDWMSRPTGGENPIALSAFRGKVVGLMSASISPFGGLRGVTHLRQILSTIQTLVIPEQVMVPFADKAFDGDQLVDAMPRQLLDMLTGRLVRLAAAGKA